MAKHAGQWIRLGVLALVVVGELAACAAGPLPLASIMDECGRPTAANRDWCFSVQFPNAN